MKILESAEFRAMWELWHQHRKELKKKITPTAEKMQLKKLESWGEAKAIFAIERSIEAGWQGLFEPKDKDMPPPKNIPQSFLPAPVQRAEVEEFSPEQKLANIRKIREMITSKGVLKSWA